MKIKSNSPNSIGDLVAGLLTGLKDPPAAAPIQDSLNAFWREHVGIAAAHSCPFAYASSRLVIFCESGVWSTRLRHQLPSLKRQLTEHGFSFNEVVLRVSPELAETANKAKLAAYERKGHQTIAKATAQQIANTCKHISHQRLQRALEKLSKHGR